MAAIVVLPPTDLSFKHSLAMVEYWAEAEPSDEDKLKFLEQAIKDLGQPRNVEIFRDAMKELGHHAIKADHTFYDVWITLAKVVTYHHDQYPGIKPFFEEWHNLRRVGLRSYSSHC